MLKNLFKFILKLMAQAVIWRHKPKVVAITGSVGKTMAKEAIFSVISRRFSAWESAGNFNNEFGLPFSVLGAGSGKNFFWQMFLAKWNFFRFMFSPSYPAVLILEMGADRVGDIAYLTKIALPDIAVITRVGSAHTEFFGDIETVQREKSQLVKSLKKSGIAILNADDPRVAAMRHMHSGKTVTFGLGDGADVRATAVMVQQLTLGSALDPSVDFGMKFLIEYRGFSHPVFLKGCLGLPFVYACLAAFAVGIAMKIGVDDVISSLQQFSAKPGRLRPLAGIYQSIILDDTYNSSPEAVIEALKVLKQIRGRRRIAVLGDMLELGVVTQTAHRRIGRLVRELGVDLLFTVGQHSRLIAAEAKARGFAKTKIFEFETAQQAVMMLEKKITQGDVVLIKGSQAVRMEKVVKQIMAQPNKAVDLLCRQTGKWAKS